MYSKEDCKKMSRKIHVFFALMLMLILVIPVAVEFDLYSMGYMKGAFVGGDEQAIYIIEVAMFFLTGSAILFALKFFDRLLRRVSEVHEARGEDKASAYFGAYMIRIALLAMPMLSGILFYYGMLANWGLYYALAGFVASFFCLPSAEDVEREMNRENGQSDTNH